MSFAKLIEEYGMGLMTIDDPNVQLIGATLIRAALMEQGKA